VKPELAAANAAVDEAVAVVREGRGKPMARIGKAAKDFLTEVDMASEAAIKQALAKSTPDIGFYGEEGGGADLHSGRVWVADPLDGTINYATGSPLCGVMLGLLEDGVPVLGVIDLPFLGVRIHSGAVVVRGWTPSSTSAARSTGGRCASAASARPPCSGRGSPPA
jgi:myo-inositol-1(or 4)-monophosphatase